MHKENAAPVAKDSQLNAVTLAAIGALACIAADMVHEAVGHGTASLLMSDPILSLSTVAVQTASPSRFASAAGTTANLIVGVLSFLLLRRVRKLTPSAYLLWLFGAFNLFNVGYLVASACMNSGDWAAAADTPLYGAQNIAAAAMTSIPTDWRRLVTRLKSPGFIFLEPRMRRNRLLNPLIIPDAVTVCFTVVVSKPPPAELDPDCCPTGVSGR
jgi:hypothetical protein